MLKNTLEPSYRYVIDGDYKRIQASTIENENTNILNAYKIWDCGSFEYEWRKDVIKKITMKL